MICETASKLILEIQERTGAIRSSPQYSLSSSGMLPIHKIN